MVKVLRGGLLALEAVAVRFGNVHDLFRVLGRGHLLLVEDLFLG